MACKPFLTRLSQPKPKRLPERKAVTIGIGFLCSDGIVLCSDTQVTWEQFHKYYESKIRHGEAKKWTAAFTYSGNPAVNKMFHDKFEETIELIKDRVPLNAAGIQKAVETTLDLIDVLDRDPNALNLLCEIVIPGEDMRLVHTEGKVVSRVESQHFIGAGDSSVIRYLAPTIAKEVSSYRVWQAINLGVYLTIQARRYVDGCGGETDVLVITPKGKICAYSLSDVYHIEQDLLKLEFLMDKAATALFDINMPDEQFQDHLKRFVKAVEDERHELKVRAEMHLLMDKHF